MTFLKLVRRYESERTVRPRIRSPQNATVLPSIPPRLRRSVIVSGTLALLVHQARANGWLPEGCHRVLPMIDARRMEVYTAVFTPEGEQLTEIQPQVITAESFRAERDAGPVLVVGDGAGKCREILAGPQVSFVQAGPLARRRLFRALLPEGFRRDRQPEEAVLTVAKFAIYRNNCYICIESRVLPGGRTPF